MARKYDLALDRPEPGFLERAGTWYFRRLQAIRAASGGQGAQAYVHSSDAELSAYIRKITIWTSIGAFAAGALTTMVAVYIQEIYATVPLGQRLAWIAGSTIITTAVEFVVLFDITVRAVHKIAHFTGQIEVDQPILLNRDSIPNLLARAALEISDPVYEFIGIDPTRLVPRRKLLIIGIFYKLKIMATNALAKLILMRFVGNSVMRVSVAYVAVILTGVWNVIVLWRVIREARLRLVGSLLAQTLATEILTSQQINSLSPEGRIGCVRAVATAVVLTQNYHPNMLILLVRLCEVLGIENPADYDDWDKFILTLGQVSKREKEFMLDLLSVSAAFDGRLSKLERMYLPVAFGEHAPHYMGRIRKLTRHVLRGELNEARQHCFTDFATNATY
ncbi:MAG: hypothetical protein K8S54_03065 [Spirochaetia bacterium]|nr:hypothetical protein [Spirochaetia bacterium]